MNKSERVVELTRFLAGNREDIPLGLRFAFLDCIMTMPEQCVPDHQSLRVFVENALEHFLGTNEHACLNYPKMARYLTRWKRIWMPGKEGEECDGTYYWFAKPEIDSTQTSHVAS